MPRQHRPKRRAELLHDVAQGSYRYLVGLSEHLGLNVTDTVALVILDRRGPMRFTDLSRILGLTSGSTTVLADRLESAGAVRRRPNPTDRRSLLIEATDGGRSLLAGVDHLQEEAEAGLRRTFSDHRESVSRYLGAVA